MKFSLSIVAAFVCSASAFEYYPRRHSYGPPPPPRAAPGANTVVLNVHQNSEGGYSASPYDRPRGENLIQQKIKQHGNGNVVRQKMKQNGGDSSKIMQDIEQFGDFNQLEQNFWQDGEWDW